jgi:hypothetical protein
MKVSFCWDVFNQLSPTNSRWAWITCLFLSNKTSSLVWFRHGYFTITYFTRFTTFGCFILQAIQNYIQEGERWGLVRNNYNKLDKVTLVRWLDRELNQ